MAINITTHICRTIYYIVINSYSNCGASVNNKQVSKVIWQKAVRYLVTPRGCEWIRPILIPSNTSPLSSE